MSKSNTVVFAYPGAKSFSGQTAMSLLSHKIFGERGFSVIDWRFPYLDRDHGDRWANLAKFLFQLVKTNLRCVRMLALPKRSLANFSHGQSLSAIGRMGPAHLFLRTLRPDLKVITSLHGSVLLNDEASGPSLKLLIFLLKHSDLITVLSQRQVQFLIKQGIPRDKIFVLNNSFEGELIGENEMRAKMEEILDPECPLRLLHLSLLMESKGYLRFLQLARSLSRGAFARPLDITVCGPVTTSAYCETRLSVAERENELQAHIDELNALPKVQACWIRGAYGEEKIRLLRKSHVFIFPTRFPVEAQPLVIIEAMACGCAIIASDQGEIPEMLPAGAGMVLEEVDGANFAGRVIEFLDSPAALGEAAASAREHAQSCYSQEAYWSQWQSMLNQLDRIETNN